MKNFKITAILLMVLSPLNMWAQFKTINAEKVPETMKVIQVDNRENSTLVFIKYVNRGSAWMNIAENTIAKIPGSNREFHLINSINLPINSESENRFMMFDKADQEHAFVLEFEKIPEIANFSIYESTDSSNAFNFIGLRVDTLQKAEYMNIDNFVASYPVKEFGRFADKGTIVSYIKYKGLLISTVAQAVKQYGKYYTINLNIQNLSGRSALFDPSKITAKGYTKKTNTFFDMQVLSAMEYDKKVANKQAWNNFWVALGEGMAASNAGYSSSSTSYSGSSYTTANAHASGYVGNTYGYANAYGSAYTTTYGKANTTSYNGAAAYAAQQQANANYNAYANNQYSIRKQLNDGYVKLNTIRNEVNYTGYFNIKFKKLGSVN